MQPLTCDLWLMERNAMRQFLSMASAGIRPDDAEHVRERQQSKREKTLAVVPIVGVIEARPTWLGDMFGMTSYEAIGYAVDTLMHDDSVKGIVFDVMSPGGMAYGAPELAEKIYSYRGVKPMISVANPIAASGAFWLAAAADRVVMTPSGDVGSVGVIWEHVDFSQADAAAGLKTTVIRSTDAPHKAETNSSEPLSEEARENMQVRADAIHQQFASDLARFRGVSVQHVNEQFGRGRLVDAKRAVAAGMVDKVMTLQETLVKLGSGRIRIASNRTEDDWDAPTDRELRMQRIAAVRSAAESVDQPIEEETEHVEP